MGVKLKYDDVCKISLYIITLIVVLKCVRNPFGLVLDTQKYPVRKGMISDINKGREIVRSLPSGLQRVAKRLSRFGLELHFQKTTARNITSGALAT